VQAVQWFLLQKTAENNLHTVATTRICSDMQRHCPFTSYHQLDRLSRFSYTSGNIYLQITLSLLHLRKSLFFATYSVDIYIYVYVHICVCVMCTSIYVYAYMYILYSVYHLRTCRCARMQCHTTA
jgi:hypothetical protein